VSPIAIMILRKYRDTPESQVVAWRGGRAGHWPQVPLEEAPKAHKKKIWGAWRPVPYKIVSAGEGPQDLWFVPDATNPRYATGLRYQKRRGFRIEESNNRKLVSSHLPVQYEFNELIHD
jgi:hypothetical protein